jgi:hypothetical protein
LGRGGSTRRTSQVGAGAHHLCAFGTLQIVTVDDLGSKHSCSQQAGTMPHHCSKRAPSASSSIFLQQTCTCQPSACPACILRPLPAELHWGHESQPVCNGGERKRRQVVLQTISSSSCRCALIICAPPEEDLDPGDFLNSSSHKGAQRWMSRVWLPAMYLSGSCVDSNAHIATVGTLRLHSAQEGINCSSGQAGAVFEGCPASTATSTAVLFAVLQIYNECVNDLLAPAHVRLAKPASLRLKEGMAGHINVQGLSEVSGTPAAPGCCCCGCRVAIPYTSRQQLGCQAVDKSAPQIGQGMSRHCAGAVSSERQRLAATLPN